ncbi:MAG: hypothetical protein CSA21_03950 [Deltaproteobacteria bacterium]|nr:MAG: hypothetical protein CSA21_03950 [Deltaproteobacteria bacterium]
MFSCKKKYPRLLEQISAAAREVWLFEDVTSRRKKASELRAAGQEVTLHSAYKPLLHTVLEQDLLRGVKEARIRYPVVAGDEPDRFRLECYPLTALVTTKLSFSPVPVSAQEPVFYQIETAERSFDIRVPVRWQRRLWGQKVLAACALCREQDGTEYFLVSEYEQMYADACRCFWQMPLVPRPGSPPQGPFFDRLQLDITLPAKDQPLAVEEEHISLSEALHEDLYFSALEIFAKRLGLEPGSRSLTPGQVLPKVVYGEAPTLAIHEKEITAERKGTFSGTPSLSGAGHWLTPGQVENLLAEVGGRPFSARSRQGRPIWGRFFPGSNAVARIALSGGQHANESSGVVGALRAALALREKGDVAFTVCPLGNPDGYAAFRELCEAAPRHMHHAARYTAAGNDLTACTGWEMEMRLQARALLPADLHLNLHGYPAHEWTRPLSGYVPAGFSRWTIPKGYFVICRYLKPFQPLAATLVKEAIAAISGHEAQLEQNLRMLRRYRQTVGEVDFQVAAEAVPFTFEEVTDALYPIEIITEAADETVYGESFRIAHQTHFLVTMALVKCLCEQ